MKKENQDLKIVDEHQEQIVFETNSFFDKLKEWFHNTLSISNKSYDRILAGAEHPAECIAVYMHLVRTARWQKTNSVWAKDIYIKNGLKLGNKKIKVVKTELKKLGLIDYKYIRDDTGKITKVFIKILYLPTFKTFSSSGSKTTIVENDYSGKDEQVLKERNEMLKEDSPDEDFSFEQLKNLSISSPAEPDCVNAENRKEENLEKISLSPEKMEAADKEIAEREAEVYNDNPKVDRFLHTLDPASAVNMLALEAHGPKTIAEVLDYIPEYERETGRKVENTAGFVYQGMLYCWEKGDYYQWGYEKLQAGGYEK